MKIVDNTLINEVKFKDLAIGDLFRHVNDKYNICMRVPDGYLHNGSRFNSIFLYSGSSEGLFTEFSDNSRVHRLVISELHVNYYTEENTIGENTNEDN